MEKDRLSAVDSFYFSVITFEHGWFWRFRSSKHETNRVLVWLGYIGLWYFRHHDRFFLQYRQYETRLVNVKKALSKTFRNKDKLRKAKISLNEGSTALVRNNSYLKFESKGEVHRFYEADWFIEPHVGTHFFHCNRIAERAIF